MKFYLKSAGRKDSQDYVWVPLEGDMQSRDLEVLRTLERLSDTRLRVVTISVRCDAEIAIYLGNAPSGRRDFYGTPIFNRIAVLLPLDEESLDLVEKLAIDWMSDNSLLVRQLAQDVRQSDAQLGFSYPRELVSTLISLCDKIDVNTGGAGLNSEINSFLKDSKQDRNRTKTFLQQKTSVLAAADGRTNLNEACGENSNMNIFFLTSTKAVEYSWWRNLAPPSDGRLRAISEYDALLFSALAEQRDGKWTLFLQDLFWTDEVKHRVNRITVVIENPGSDAFAEKRTRRLLIDWLSQKSRLLSTLKDLVNLTSENLIVDERHLKTVVEAIANDGSIRLGTTEFPSDRYLFRLNEDYSNADELKQKCCNILSQHRLDGRIEGVQFLFTGMPYSEIKGSYASLPDMPAKLIVAGTPLNEKRAPPPSPPSASSKLWLCISIVIVAILVAILMLVSFTGSKTETHTTKITNH